MNNFKLALDCGEILVFQYPTRNNKYVAIGGAGKDKDGNYRYSGWWNTIEYCYKYIGCWNRCSINILEDFKYISSTPHAFGDIVPVGTRVKILDNAEKECRKYEIGFSDRMKEMVGKIYEIKSVNGGTYYICGWSFPRSAFVIAQEEEVEKTVDDVLGRFVEYSGFGVFLKQLSEEDKEIIKKALK